MNAKSTKASWSLVLGLCVSACLSSPPSDEERTAFATPPRAGFEPVSDMLHARCGSLDCHGHVARNLRLYGINGLRLSPADVPGAEGGSTTAGEHDRNYAALAALEPEILDRVIAEGGNDPARLTLVRKAHGTEDHEGGAAIAAGSAADRCIGSWLALAIDRAACESGAQLVRPVPR